ncbi:hypothetical protein [Gudongella oleilytica]|uniref:hypothetical protein n=1 Tax=Gudongella oleilytica TaxID=1582259 RepID=UPI000EE5F05D|nr:hypothetical protein [Gudongella oleilytica]HCO18718.1 hypothetical protein [Tissierellales bacterium]
MENKRALDRRGFYIIAGICALLILFNSLEAAAKVKDVEMFNKWFQETYMGEQITESNFQEYLVSNMAEYFLKTAFPVSIALTAYFAIGKSRVFGAMVYVWLVISLGGFIYHLLQWDFYSIFYYIGIVLYIILIVKTYSIALLGTYNSSEGGD